MASMPNAAKKPSINALLNNQPASHQIPGTTSVNGVQHFQAHSHYTYQPKVHPQGAYSLKAANWPTSPPFPAAPARNSIPNGHHRHGSEPQAMGYMSGSYVLGSPAVEPMGGQFPARLETPAPRWHSQPSTQPSYHPRQGETIISSVMPSQTMNAHDSFAGTDYQTADRVSLRLAARELAPTSQAYPIHQQANDYSRLTNGRPDSHAPQAQAYQPANGQPSSSSHSTQRRTSSKRQLSEEDANESAPKPKRTTKTKAKGRTEDGHAPSKRGFSSKKRVEAAQATVQGEQSLPHVAFSTDEGKEGDRMPFSTIANSGPAHKVKCERQYARCMSTKYKNDKFPRCVSCTRRWAGDTCRFQGIRYLLRNIDDNTVHSVAFADRADVSPFQHNHIWNIPLTLTHIQRTKRVIASALLPILKVDRHHLTLPELVKRTRESEVRVTCDSCMTSIFSTSWFCRLCGREACPDCYEQVKFLTYAGPNATRGELEDMRARREKAALSNPFFLSCNKRIEHEAWHFSPMSRFSEQELDEAIVDMQSLLHEQEDPSPLYTSTHSDGHHSTAITYPPNPTVPAASLAPEDGEGRSWNEVYLANQTKPRFLPPELEPSGAAGAQYIPPTLTEAAASVPSMETYRFTDAEVSGVDSSVKFSKIWAHGEPLVVANILDKFKINWSPQYFIEKFGEKQCLITECESDQNKQTTISEFFSTFGKYEGRSGVWKLKDWPPSADFKTTFPELFKDFSDAVPVPDYVRRDGVYNIASHFPANAVAPDLGPKMYNAYAGKQGAGSKGSTRLHMDMADALNVMLYSANCPDGSPGCALWDIFSANDSDKIRTFLRKVHNLLPPNDPIHGQQYYLDDDLRHRLYQQHGVKSYRIYQRPGEAIFIPAGCAHQVLNMSDSVKIAIDYVSPENIYRCEKLTREFREVNKSKVWKEDILQLKAMMWFAWQSCRQAESQLMDTSTSPSSSHS